MRLDRQEVVHLSVLIVLSFFLYFFYLGSIDLWGTSEFRYAQLAKEMYEGGPWLLPHLNGEPYYSKPPLFFWTVVLLSKLQGEVNELAARLPSALGALGTVIVTYFLGSSILGRTGGIMAALILASSPKFHAYARVVRLDSLYTFFMASALAAFYYGYTQERKHYLVFSGLAVALATLTKGPLAIFFPLVIISWYLLLHRNLGYLRSSGFLAGVLTFFLAVSLWAVPAFLSGWEPYVKGFTGENVTYYVTTRAREMSCIYNYLQDVFLGAAPWAFFLPVVFYHRFTGREDRGCEKGLSFLFIWFLVIFFGFVISFERRSPYILPLYPALSILIASFFCPRIGVSREGRSRVTAPVLYLLGIVVGLTTGAVANNPKAEPLAIFFAAAVAFSVFGLIVFLSLRSRDYKLFFLSALIILVSCEISQNVYFLPRVNDKVSTKAVGKEVARVLEKEDSLAVYKSSLLLYTFYTNTYPRWVGTKEELVHFLNSQPRAYCLMLEKYYLPLKGELQAFPARRLVVKENTYILIGNSKKTAPAMSE